MYELRFRRRWDRERVRGAACSACGAVADARVVLVASAPDLPTYALLRCPRCRARFFEPTPRPDYSAHTDDDYGVRHYAEVGAGIGSIHNALFRPLGRDFDGSVLDVGCGYGFALDLVETLTNGSAVGLEPSKYGQVGARELGVTILRAHLGEPGELDGRRFDVVFASEVLEHVEQPQEFLSLVRERLEPDGVVVLTTPNAEVVHRRNASRSFMFPVLSLGAHTVLYTPPSLRRLLRAAGFRDVRLRVERERIVAYACRTSFADRGIPDPEDVLEYYERKLEDQAIGPSTRVGLAYRLCRDRVNRGEHARAASLVDAVPLPAESALDEIATAEELGAAMPFCAPCHSFYRAVLKAEHERDREGAERAFGLASRLLRLKIAVMPTSSPEEMELLDRGGL